MAAKLFVNLTPMRVPAKLLLSSTSTIPPAKPAKCSSMEDARETRTDFLRWETARRGVLLTKVSVHFSKNFMFPKEEATSCVWAALYGAQMKLRDNVLFHSLTSQKEWPKSYFKFIAKLSVYQVEVAPTLS